MTLPIPTLTQADLDRIQGIALGTITDQLIAPMEIIALIQRQSVPAEEIAHLQAKVEVAGPLMTGLSNEIDRLTRERNHAIVAETVLGLAFKDALKLIPPGFVNCRGDGCRMANCAACFNKPVSNELTLAIFKDVASQPDTPYAWFHAVPWNELAAVMDAAEENDPALWIREKHKEWSESFLASLTQEHFGDCTRAPMSCLRCHAETRKKTIDDMRAALRGSPSSTVPGANHE